MSDIKMLRLVAQLKHKHSAKCKKDVNECAECQANIKWFASLSLPDLSKVLSE